MKTKSTRFSETVLLHGHIIDSLTFSKVLDRIMEEGARFTIKDIRVGQRKYEQSRASLAIETDSQKKMDALLKNLRNLGAEVMEKEDVQLARAPMNGVFPEGFYTTTNLETWIRIRGQWKKMTREEMDAGIRVNPRTGSAEPVRFAGVRKGDSFVVGQRGVKVVPLERPRDGVLFEFMTSDASTEKPKVAFIRPIAELLRKYRNGKGKVCIVAGPAIIHTGAHHDLSWLIQNGYVHLLFAGNALATHDMEAALYGTSLGMSLESGAVTHGGHEHHLRAINLIRRLGSIRAAVQRGKLRSGIMAACVRKKVPFVLAGSIRDDGPLPEVITDVTKAQQLMREHLKGVDFVLMLATTLHSVATGNLLPARVRTVCVDMNPSAVTKLSDRGTWQSTSLVTDIGYFLRELRSQLQRK